MFRYACKFGLKGSVFEAIGLHAIAWALGELDKKQEPERTGGEEWGQWPSAKGETSKSVI